MIGIERMFGDSIADLELAISKLIATELPLELPRLRRCIDQLESIFVTTAREAERVGELDDLHLAPAGALAAQCRMTPSAARRALKSARVLEELTDVRHAAITGATTTAHVDAIARVATPERLEAIKAFDSQIADAATRFDLRGLNTVLLRICERIDDAPPVEDAIGLHVSPTFQGSTRIDGWLDPETGETVITAIEIAMAEQTGDDRRHPKERRAEALGDICRFYVDHHQEHSGLRARPDVTVVVDLEVLQQDAPLLVDRVRGEFANSGTVSRKTLLMLACDCNISRVITDGRSQIIDVGRSTRAISAAMRRALVARDGGCTTPGCGRPPSQCDVHHKKHWCDGGPTDLENLELKCRPCHRKEHDP